MKWLMHPRVLVILWMLGFLVSFVIQTVFQSQFAAATLWGENRGWQNEIAIWNVGMFLVLTGILTANVRIENRVLPGLFILSLCFGSNHVLAIVQSPASLGNWAGALANTGAVALYGYYLLGQRRTSGASPQ